MILIDIKLLYDLYIYLLPDKDTVHFHIKDGCFRAWISLDSLDAEVPRGEELNFFDFLYLMKRGALVSAEGPEGWADWVLLGGLLI